MTILTPSPRSSNLLSTTSTPSQILWILSPALTHSLYFATAIQKVLSSTTLFLFLRCYLVSALLLQLTHNTLLLLALQVQYASAILARESKRAWRKGWKKSERIRKRLFFEFMVFVLGEGNGLILLLFWPGWIVVSVAVWGIWKVCG